MVISGTTVGTESSCVCLNSRGLHGVDGVARPAGWSEGSLQLCEYAREEPTSAAGFF